MREEGSIFGSAGCNDYRAAYGYPTPHNTLERIVVDDPFAYPRECPDSRDLPDEKRFFAVLGGLGEYPSVSMDGRKLIFSAPEQAEKRSPA